MAFAAKVVAVARWPSPKVILQILVIILVIVIMILIMIIGYVMINSSNTAIAIILSTITIIRCGAARVPAASRAAPRGFSSRGAPARRSSASRRSA